MLCWWNSISKLALKYHILSNFLTCNKKNQCVHWFDKKNIFKSLNIFLIDKVLSICLKCIWWCNLSWVNYCCCNMPQFIYHILCTKLKVCMMKRFIFTLTEKLHSLFTQYHSITSFYYCLKYLMNFTKHKITKAIFKFLIL